MNIEGTPHERVLIVIFSYIIGFTSAFILFYHVMQPLPSMVQTVPATSQMGAVVASENVQRTAPSAPAEADSSIRLVYENNGLYWYSGAEFPTLLSKDAAAAGITLTDEMTTAEMQGFHSDVHGYQEFAGAGMIFYCEQYSVAGTCTPYLYDTDQQVLHVVQNQNGPLTLTATQAERVSIAPTGLLRIGAYTSTDALQPWVVR